MPFVQVELFAADPSHQESSLACEPSPVEWGALSNIVGRASPVRLFVPNDDLFSKQWNLQNIGQPNEPPGIDINVTAVWDDYTGSGVRVAIYDDGVDYKHSDLNANYDVSSQVKINGVVQNPFPASSIDAHGTAVAGIIGAENDGSGTVGVAFNATLTGANIFVLSDSEFDQAMAQQQQFDVVNHSWGWSLPFTDNQFDPAWSDFFQGINDAVAHGRDGLGTVLVVAGGNDRTSDGNSGIARDVNDSIFSSSRFAIAVAAVDNTGEVSWYSTPGASLLVAAPSSGGTQGISTTDRKGSAGYSSGDYTSTFGGTSAASPTVAGVVALMLEANPNLGWRDVQEILTYSSRHVGSPVGSGQSGNELYAWSFNNASNWNGGGLHFSNDYGFGLVDALAATRLAETWTKSSTLSNETTLTALNGTQQKIPDKNPAGITYGFSVAANLDIEHVSISLDMSTPHKWVGDLVITLTSPDGTVSTLLNRIGEGALGTDLDSWMFSSNAFRGELSSGVWSLQIVDGATANGGVVGDVTLNIHGESNIIDNTYIYTNEYSIYAGTFGHSKTLGDSDGGSDTLNASAVSTASTIDLQSGGSNVIAGQSLTIGSNTTIENAYGGDGNDVIRGNNAGNRLDGGRGDDIISGLIGADILSGGPGDDLFFFAKGSGADTITDFVAGTDFIDEIDLTGVSAIQVFEDVLKLTRQIGADAVIDFGNGDTLMLKNVIASSITAGDFVLAAANIPKPPSNEILIAAQIVYQKMFDVAPTQSQLVNLEQFGIAQASYGSQIQVADVPVYVYQAFAHALCEGSHFIDNFGPDVIPLESNFITEAFLDVFGSQAGQPQVEHFLQQLSYFQSIYESSGAYGNDADRIDLLARGTIVGQMLGIASEPDLFG